MCLSRLVAFLEQGNKNTYILPCLNQVPGDWKTRGIFRTFDTIVISNKDNCQNILFKLSVKDDTCNSVYKTFY